MLCFPVATGEPRGSRETGVHYTGNQGRDFKIEPGIAIARRRGEEDDAGTTQNFSRRQEKNCSRTTGTLGESQGREVEETDWSRLRCD